MTLTVTRIPIKRGPKGRAAWLEARREDVTGSEVPALYGRHKYLTRLGLVRAKQYGEPEPRRVDPVKRRGHILEPAVAAAIEHDHGLLVRKVNHYLRGRDPADPYLRAGATLDFDLETDGDTLLRALDRAHVAHTWDELDDLPVRLCIETKSVDRDIYDEEWKDGPPEQHRWQGLTQAMLGGYDGCIIAALVVNYAHDLHMFAVPRNPQLEAKICADISDFWRDYEAGELPAAEARDNSSMGKWSRPPPSGSVIDLRGDMSWPLMLEEREALKERASAVAYELDSIEARIKEALGDNTAALVDGWTLTWKPDKHGKRMLLIKRK